MLEKFVGHNLVWCVHQRVRWIEVTHTYPIRPIETRCYSCMEVSGPLFIHFEFSERDPCVRGTDDVRTFFEMTEENTEIPTYEIPA